MSIIIAGRVGAREMPIRSVWRQLGGSEYERRWWGPIADVEALLPSLRSGSKEVSFDPVQGSAIAIATVRYAGSSPGVENPNEITSETMTISFSDQSFPLHQNPQFVVIGNQAIKDMEKLIKQDADNTQPVGSADFDYYELRMRGVDTYRVKLPVINWVRVVGVNYSPELDVANVGTIYNTDQVVANLGAPILWSIPAANVGVSQGDASIFKAGWMKDCEVGYTGDGQVQMTIKAEYGLWSIEAYTFAF